MTWLPLVGALLVLCRAAAGWSLAQTNPLNPEQPTLSERIREAGWDAAVTSALEADLSSKAFPKAETTLLAQIERSSQPGVLLEILAGVFFLDSDYLQAAIAYKKAERCGTLSQNARFMLAMTYIELKQNHRAREELLLLIKEKPEQPLYPYWLGRIDYDDQRFADAIAHFNQAIKVDSGFVRAYDGRGLCEEAIGHTEAAELSYRRANVLNREQASRYASPALDYGTLLAKLGRRNEASSLLREAAAIRPSWARAHYELGRVEEGSAQEAAVAEYQEAMSLDPNDPGPVYSLMRLYTKMGKKKLAEELATRFHTVKARGGPIS